MLEAIAYIQHQDAVAICRCFGSGEVLEVPGEIAGFPVTGLADHVFAAEASFKLRGERMFLAVQNELTGKWEPGTADTPDPAAAMCAGGLCEIALPDSVESIGEYAFYGCRNLRRLYLPSNLSRLGGGLFVACNHLEEIHFRGEARCIRDVIGDLSYETEAVLENPDGSVHYRLLFPEYYEDSIENTPARIIEIKYEGTGYRYRQCFTGTQVDLARYDSLFYSASVQELSGTVQKMAFDRLCYPVMLSKDAQENYLAYLKEHAGETARFCMDRHSGSHAGKNASKLLQILCGYGYFDEDRLNLFLDTAGREGDPEAVSLLMDYRRTHFRKQRTADKYAL